ncbi:MAG: ABC transporter permease subunit [Planctomycetes bacterium]|nr:ABC transporter permease subunit [Planctomycetota bacterium]
MIRFLAHRFMWFVITLFVVTIVSFGLMRMVKGGPFDSDKQLDPAIQANIEARYHLNWPMWKQFLQYTGPLNLDENGMFGQGENKGTQKFTGVLTGDFGPSFRYKDFTVNDIIGQSLPISILLGVVAMMWALALGISAGIASALRRGSGLDLTMRLAATAGIALPNFVIAGFLIIIFVFMIPLFPVAGWGSIKHMMLPGFCLGLVYAAYIARLTRTGMLEVLSQDHIRTAHAKGLAPGTVIMRHALKGGLLPVVSYLGPATAGILTGSLVIERIFNIPGMGTHFVNSALNRDYTLAMGVTILYTVLVSSFNILVDLAYTMLDPRIKLEDQ